MLKEQIEQLIEEKFAGTDYFLVEVKESPAKVAVFIDHSTGIKLNDCVELTKFIKSEFGETLDTRELEVSSPGMDEPLKVEKQYLKNIGKQISVLLKDGIRKNGVLKAASFSGEVAKDILTLEEKFGSANKITDISFDQIKETKKIISFDKVIK